MHSWLGIRKEFCGAVDISWLDKWLDDRYLQGVEDWSVAMLSYFAIKAYSNIFIAPGWPPPCI